VGLGSTNNLYIKEKRWKYKEQVHLQRQSVPLFSKVYSSVAVDNSLKYLQHRKISGNYSA